MLSKLEKLRPKLARAAQKVLRRWKQDKTTFCCPTFGAGGVCWDVALSMLKVLKRAGFQNAQDREVHFFDKHDRDYSTGHACIELIAPKTNEIYMVDIYPFKYEFINSENQWQQIPGVKITNKDITILPQRQYASEMDVKI